MYEWVVFIWCTTEHVVVYISSCLLHHLLFWHVILLFVIMAVQRFECWQSINSLSGLSFPCSVFPLHWSWLVLLNGIVLLIKPSQPTFYFGHSYMAFVCGLITKTNKCVYIVYFCFDFKYYALNFFFSLFFWTASHWVKMEACTNWGYMG